MIRYAMRIVAARVAQKLILGAALAVPFGLSVFNLLVGSQAVIAQSTIQWPMEWGIEAQPLISQANRIATALEILGQPLSPESAKALKSLKESEGNDSVAKTIQDTLDPLCMAAVEIQPYGVTKVIPGKSIPILVEQGWTLALVKVINKAGATGVLRPDSPSARPLPHAPASEVENRWLGLLPYTGQPMLPNLSGLGLEYTIVQLWSKDAETRSADITFSIEGAKNVAKGVSNLVMRDWRFAKDTDSWKAENNCTLQSDKGSLLVKILREDPFFTAPVVGPKGAYVLRFWANFDKPGVGQVFWWTKSMREAHPGKQATFNIEPGRAKEYEVRFRTNEELSGLRIDPGNDPGVARFDWIRLIRENEPGAAVASARIGFQAKPSSVVTFRVTEFDGSPTMAGFTITDNYGRIFPSQSKRLAPDFFFQQQIYRADGETVRLPKGAYKVVCRRGPESVPETKDLVVSENSAEIKYAVTRWIDPSKLGWWSGDHHIHAAGCAHYDNPTQGVEPRDMMRHILGEDLKIGCCLTWGPCFDYQKRFFSGRPDMVSKPPYLLRYDVEVSGFGSQSSGHLNLLRLKEQIYPGGNSKDHWPTLGMNTLRWAKKQGAVCGPAHSANGLTRIVARVPGANDGPGGLPNFNIPAYDGIGANELIVQDTHTLPGPDGKPLPACDFISTMDTDRVAEFNMWYHLLNCGSRIRASGETDFPCISGERVGMGRVYVKQSGTVDFDTWIQGIADGKSYVSDGTVHLMDPVLHVGGSTLDLGQKGSERKLDKAQRVKVTLQAAAFQTGKPTVPVELVVNGLPVAKQDLVCDGKTREISFDADIKESAWVAVRVFPHAHTNPFFVIVDDKPIRANADSARWCLMGVEQCWKMKKPTYKKEELAQAEADYNHARKHYEKVLSESAK